MDPLHPKSRHRSPSPWLVRLLAAGAAVLGVNCWAALGGQQDSVRADQAAFGGSHTTATLPAYSLHTHTLANGVTVRQYVDASGVVFAVGWDGPVQPDFQRLLGGSFARYQNALRQQRKGVVLQDSDLVVESGGMMRAFFGRAYLPDKVPAALSLQDIR